jgi:hypothetical protein
MRPYGLATTAHRLHVGVCCLDGSDDGGNQFGFHAIPSKSQIYQTLLRHGNMKTLPGGRMVAMTPSWRVKEIPDEPYFNPCSE